MEDVKKRDAYRRAHGLDKEEGFGGWTARTDGNEMGGGLKLEPEVKLAVEGGEGGEGEEVQVERRERRPVKKWLGIW